MTLPKHHRSGRTPKTLRGPAVATRNPVMTSSKMSSAPTRSHASRKPSRKPGAGRDQAHVGRDRLDDHAGHVVADPRHHVVGDDQRLGHRRLGHPGRGRQTQGGHPAPPAGQEAVAVAVVTAREQHHPVPPGRPRASRTADMAASVPLLTSRTCRSPAPGRRSPRRAAPPARSAPRTTCRRPAARRTASTTLGWAWPEDRRPVGLDVVEVAVAVDVPYVGALAPGHEVRASRPRTGTPAPAS